MQYLYGEQSSCVSIYAGYRSPSTRCSRKNAHKINIIDVLVSEYNKHEGTGHTHTQSAKILQDKTREHPVYLYYKRIKDQNQIKNQYVRCSHANRPEGCSFDHEKH